MISLSVILFKNGFPIAGDRIEEDEQVKIFKLQYYE